MWSMSASPPNIPTPNGTIASVLFTAIIAVFSAGPSPEMSQGESWQPDRPARRRIRAVKRQFEALRPKRERLLAQADGEEIDMDALIRAQCDLAANGEGSHKIFSTTRQAERDLSVSVLLDTSRSSESWIEGRQVIEIARETLMALALGLAACGDDNALYSFSSLRRDRVTVSTLKAFDETLGPRVFSRIGALKPGFYTRFGAAIRHVTSELMDTASSARLLLVITDGKPNDLDHYEGALWARRYCYGRARGAPLRHRCVRHHHR